MGTDRSIAVSLLDDDTAPATKRYAGAPGGPTTHTFWLEGTSGAVSATIDIVGELMGGGEITIVSGQVVSGTGAGAGAQAGSGACFAHPIATPYLHFKHKLTAISGTGAKIHSAVVSESL